MVMKMLTEFECKLLAVYVLQGTFKIQMLQRAWYNNPQRPIHAVFYTRT